MTHLRQQIREHVVALLDTTAVPAVASRVYPIQRHQLPIICIYTLTEASEQDTLDPSLIRDLQLAIDIYARNNEGAPDDILDGLAEQVETLMKADIRLNRLAVNSFLAETAIGFAGEGEQANGLARLRYTVRYRTT